MMLNIHRLNLLSGKKEEEKKIVAVFEKLVLLWKHSHGGLDLILYQRLPFDRIASCLVKENLWTKIIHNKQCNTK
jgi:hypothetical protein